MGTVKTWLCGCVGCLCAHVRCAHCVLGLLARAFVFVACRNHVHLFVCLCARYSHVGVIELGDRVFVCDA